MYSIVELWAMKQAWRDLSPQEREADFAAQTGVMAKHAEMGIVTKMVGTNDADTDNRVPYTHFSIVEAPDEASAKTFEADLLAIGWYDCFDQVSARGAARSVEEVIAEHIGL